MLEDIRKVEIEILYEFGTGDGLFLDWKKKKKVNNLKKRGMEI